MSEEALPAPTPAPSAPAAPATPAGASASESTSATTADPEPAGIHSARFRMVAMNAVRSSQSADAAKPASSLTPETQAPPDGPLPPLPGAATSRAATEPTPPSEAASTGGGSAQGTPLLKSKLLYDIARTKMLTSRTLYRLSTETGYIKLRSRTQSRQAAAGSSSASAMNGSASDAAGAENRAEGADGGSKAAGDYKAVVGWKEKGAIDSGKKAPPPTPPSMFDTVAVYVEMIDRTGMWRNCAGVFGLMFLTYVLTSLRFGIFGLAIAATYGAQWYRNSIIRYRRAVKDDIERAYEKATITRTLESVGWLNEFVTRFWLMFEPSLSRMVIDIVDPILAQSAPGFVDSLRLTTFTLGTKAPRIDGVRTYSELEDRNQIVMDWHASFTPNDLSDVPAVLRENRVNPKVVLTVRVGKGFIGAGMPILVENMVFKGKMQVKLQLGPVFPHVRTAEVCFLERPSIDFSLKPVGGDMLGFDIAHIPGLRTFILDMMHSTIGPMFYAPNRFTIDVEQIISGAVANIPSAKGVLIVHMHGARGLPKMDTFGKADPYVRISTIKHPEHSDKTEIIEKTLSPSWNQKLFLLIYSKSDTINMEVFDWNNVGKDDKIGFVSYPMRDLLEEPEVEGVTMPIKMGETERGNLTFDMSYFPVSIRTTQAASVDADGNPLDPSVEAAKAALEEEDGAGDDSYEPDVSSNTGLLRLFVRSASDLAATPALARKLCVRAEARVNGKVVIACPESKNTDTPSWEIGKEEFVPDRDCAVIHLRLIDTSNDRTLGTLRVKIDDALAHQSGENGSDWYPLMGHPKGRVRLNVKWRPILMDPSIATSLGQGKKLPGPPIGFVKLTCHEGRGLKNVEAASGRKSDPYLAIMVQNQVRAKTRYIANSLDPVWNETLFIPVHGVSDTLALECYDWNRIDRDKPLGDALLKVSRLMGTKTKDEHGDFVFAKTEPLEMWASLRQRNGKIKGEIRFRAAFVPVINFDDMLSEADKARGTLDMSISNGGLVLGEEELETIASKAASSSSSSSDEEGTDSRRPVPARSGSKAGSPNGGPNMPRDPKQPVESVLSGMTGPGADTLSQALARFPRLPNIDYAQFKAGVISVAIIGCRGLVRPFAGVFVTMYLNGNKQAPVHVTSPSRRRGREHVWDDEFSQAAVPETQFDKLSIEVKCQPPGVHIDKDEMISVGRVEFSMEELLRQKMVNTSEPVWLRLDADTGEVLVLIRYDPVEDPQLLASESITDQGMVRMRIKSATHLPAADKSGTSDPYVVALIDGVKVWEGETIKKTLNPCWNEQGDVGIRLRSKSVLTLEVYDWNQFQSHTLLGTLTLPLKDLPISELVEKSYPLASSNGKAEMQLAFLFKPGYVEQHDDSSPVLLDVAHTVVKAPVTVIKGGASIVGNVVGGIFGKIGGKKGHRLGGRKRGDSASSSESGVDGSKLSPAAAQAMAQAPNMPLDDDQKHDLVTTASTTAVNSQGGSAARIAGFPRARGASAIPTSPLTESADAFPGPGTLHVTIESASIGDSGSHAGRKRNLVVAVELNHKTLHKTRVEKDTTHAVWDGEQLALPVLQGGAPTLKVLLKDHASFLGDKELAVFSLNTFAELKSELLSSGGARGTKTAVLTADGATVTLQLDFTGRDSVADDSFETSSIAGSVLGKHGEKHRRRGSAFSRKSANR
ncbi:Tricalbin-2 [Coemansia biformis]|uniref:Tricalbin-2 n=1 Tax=Coemansia biformis TaxID=1286918 RepID=A0A9W8CZK4_9FUNG|nr:Tricalbin-2 [Coemansia biformis]